MKKVLIGLMLLYLFTGCANQGLPYISQAGSDFKSDSLETEMRQVFIDGKEKTPHRFRIFSAVDNKTEKYILITPLRRSTSMPDFYTSFALQLEKARELILQINKAITYWDKKFADNKVISFVYSVRNEKSTFRFNFQKSQNSLINLFGADEQATFYLHSGKKFVLVNSKNNHVYEYSYAFKVRSLKDLIFIRDLLEKALQA